MPEDDFDIYGEDDGFNASKNLVVCKCSLNLPSCRLIHVRRKTEENQLPDEEQIATVISSNEPIVGDKRPRPEEVKEEQSPTLQQASRVNPAVQQVSNNLNGNYNGNGNGVGMGMVQGQGQDLSSMGYDALYIGDLQWVRLSLYLAL